MLMCVCFELRLYAYFVRTFDTVNKKNCSSSFSAPPHRRRRRRSAILLVDILLPVLNTFLAGSTRGLARSAAFVHNNSLRRQQSGRGALYPETTPVCFYNIVHLCYTVQQKTSTMHVIKRGSVLTFLTVS